MFVLLHKTNPLGMFVVTRTPRDLASPPEYFTSLSPPVKLPFPGGLAVCSCCLCFQIKLSKQTLCNAAAEIG